MTFRPISHEVFAAAGDGLAAALRDVLPADSRVKHLMAVCGLSEPTAGRILRGELPSTQTLLTVWRRFGMAAVNATLRPIMGDVSELSNAARFAAMSRSLKELAEHVDEIRLENASGIGRAAGLLGLRSAPALGHAAEPEGRSDVGGRAPDGVGQQDQPSVATTHARLSAAALTRSGSERLRRALSLFYPRQISLDFALSHIANDPWTGVAHRTPGKDWIVNPAKENRFWRGSVGPRPLASLSCSKYAETLRHDFAEAARSPDPIYFRHAGAIRRGDDFEPIMADVLRIGSIANDGTEIVVATFERKVAA